MIKYNMKVAPPVPGQGEEEKTKSPTFKVPSTVGKSYYGYRISSVLEMQKAMAALSQTMKNRDKDSLEYFIANYAGQSYQPPLAARVQPIETKVEEQRVESEEFMRDILESLMQTGYSKSFTQLDGIWGPRTQKALENMYGLAKGLFDFNTRLGFKTQEDITSLDISTLQSEIYNGEHSNTSEKDKKAKIITPIIRKLNLFTISLFTQIQTIYTKEVREIPTKQKAETTQNIDILLSTYGNETITVESLKIPTDTGGEYILSNFQFNLNYLKDAKGIIDKIINDYRTYNEEFDPTARELFTNNLYKHIKPVLDQLKAAASEYIAKISKTYQ